MTTVGKTIAWVIVLILVIWGIVQIAQTPEADLSESIKVGVILPLTGDAAVYGEPGRNVIALATEEINNLGGVNGRQLEMIYEDGKCSGPAAASAAQKLINVDKVQAIIGGFCSGESLAAEPIATNAKVLLFSPGSSSPDLTGKSQYFVRNYPSDSAQGQVLAEVAYNDKVWKNVAFMQEQTDYALGLFNAFDSSFTELGGATTKEEFPSTTAEFRSVLTKLKASNPDALFLSVQTPAIGERILKQIAELKWNIPLLVSDIIPGDVEMVKNNKAVLEGALVAEFGVNADNPLFKLLADSYKAKYGADMPFQSYGQTEYDAVYMLRDGMIAVGNDGEKLSKWMRTVTDFEGATGKITIGENGDPLSGHRPEVIKDGAVMPYQK